MEDGDDGTSPSGTCPRKGSPVAFLIVLLGGGTKKRQQKDIERASSYENGTSGEREDEHGAARDFKATVVSRVKTDPAFAQALLDDALTLLLNGDSDTSKLILRDLVNATIGFESLSEDLHKPSKSLHRMLSRSGNLTLENFSAVLGAISRLTAEQRSS